MKKIGDRGEIQAIEFLKAKGYSILTTNYKFGRVGEIDIVASRDGCTIFIEVKKRQNDFFGHPLESITFSKRKKIYTTILSYIAKYSLSEENIRFDVISILGDSLEHLEGIELI